MYVALALCIAVGVAYSMTWFRYNVKLLGKHVIITGGSEGLGYSLAREFCKKGCRVTILARTQSKLDQAVTNLQQLAVSAQVQIQAIPADVTRFEQVR